ncbi:hypothetical protein ES705_32134 [subsurface metagenome]
MMIALAEQELVQEGFSQDDLITACDIHLELFKDNIEKSDLEVPADHPIARFQEDHRVILHLMEELRETVLKFASHTRKEQNILYVTALEVITDEEWNAILDEF